ncbi:MAG TPA: hypothetical protein VM925_12570 [Labilithrix sp.]|jgi:hypothetical protein|nr:hypothetical protein [Labilithrix sp.]
MTYSHPALRNTRVEVLLETLAHEKHTRGALLVAFLEELRAAVKDRAPDSTRALLTRAETGDMSDADFQALLDELRAVVRSAA